MQRRSYWRKHLRAFREFKYIWLAIDWESFYRDYSEQDRHQESLKDANLTEENLMIQYLERLVENIETCKKVIVL